MIMENIIFLHFKWNYVIWKKNQKNSRQITWGLKRESAVEATLDGLLQPFGSIEDLIQCFQCNFQYFCFAWLAMMKVRLKRPAKKLNEFYVVNFDKNCSERHCVIWGWLENQPTTASVTWARFPFNWFRNRKISLPPKHWSINCVCFGDILSGRVMRLHSPPSNSLARSVELQRANCLRRRNSSKSKKVNALPNLESRRTFCWKKKYLSKTICLFIYPFIRFQL